MHLVIFESPSWRQFAPLCLTRPVFSLASGAGTLLERQLRRFRPSRVTFWVRPEMAEFCLQRVAPAIGVPALVNQPLDNHPALLLNAASMHPIRPADGLTGPYVERASNGEISLTFLTSEGLCAADVLQNSVRWQELTALSTHPCSQSLALQIADVIHENERLLTEDFSAANGRFSAVAAGPYHCVNDKDIRIANEVTLAPGVVLDASAGPILIDVGATIGANSVIEGPCYIGAGSMVRPLSLVRGGMTIGASCKVGGELAESIIQGNSNKVHDGYLGHSFLGEWVNLGAGTTTSNLKNTYGPISLQIGSREQPTNRMFLGSLIGDYTKAAIGTRLMSGTYLGVSSMVATSAHAPRFLPSFTFLTDTKQERYAFRKAVEVASRVYARRRRIWSGLDESVLVTAQEMASTVEA